MNVLYFLLFLRSVMETLYLILAMLMFPEAMPSDSAAYSDRRDLAESYCHISHNNSRNASSTCYPDSDTLDVAVVDATRNRSASASVPLHVIDRKNIERRGITQLHEALRTLAGISVKDYGGIGGLKTVSVRNMGAQHTTVSYDGFAITDAQNGQVDLSGFMLEHVEELTAVIGPSDDIFQSARILGSSGTLNIKTREVSDKLEGSAGVYASCFGTWYPHFHIGGKIKDKSSIRAYANYLTSKGSYPFLLKNGILQTKEKRLNSDIKTLNTEIDFRHNTPVNSGIFSLKGTYTRSERGLPGPVILYYQNPSERLWDSKTGIYAKYNWRWGLGWKSEVAGSYSRNQNRYLNENPATAKPEDNHYLQQEACISVIIGYNTGNWRFSAAEDLFSNILDSDIPECPFPVRLSSMTAVSAQYKGERLKVTASVSGRYVKEWLRGIQTNASGWDKTDSKTLKSDAPEPLLRFSPSVSVTYSILNDNRLIFRASAKEGYRVPTFNDLYYARVGNTALTPEKALLTNIGIVWNHNGGGLECTASIDGYFNFVRDKITAIPTMFIWKMRNIGKVLMAGADFNARIQWKISHNVSLHTDANYSYQYAVDVTDRNSKAWKQQIPYSPRHTGNVVISLATRWITATYTLIGAGKRYSLPQNVKQNLIDSYTDHAISLGRSFNTGPVSLKINIEALNLSNNNYEIIKGYPMPGRTYRISLKIKY